MSDDPAVEPRPGRVAAALALLLATVLGIVLALIFVILPDPAPRDIAPLAKPEAALTDRVLFVVVDGLRYDVATSPSKMPNFARAMREHAHAEVWAGQVTMTTSAILSYGTGRPGRFEQILRNLDPAPPPHNNWLDNAKNAGRSLMSVGDPAWPHMYRDALVEHRKDPKGASIDVDFNHLTFRDTRDLLRKEPNFLVAHFVTPDHQGHAYGILSQRYVDHMRSFDRLLFELLGELPPNVTVVVTSDHGAVDSGTHGSDTAVQRRCPAFAYGPGIAKGAAPPHLVLQVDLAPTLAALLGVAPPAHGLGMSIVEWLQIPDQARAERACAEAEAVQRYGVRAGASLANDMAGCAPSEPPLVRIVTARGAVRGVDAALADAAGIASPKAWAIGAVALALLALCLLLVFGRRALPRLPSALALIAIATWLILDVERLPGLWPVRVRAALFVLLIGPSLALVLAPKKIAALGERRPWWLAAYLPGFLAVAYPSNLQPLAWIAVFVLGALLIRAPALAPNGPSLLRAPGSLLGVGLLLACFLILLRVGTRASGMTPGWYSGNPSLMWSGAAVAVIAWMALRRTRLLGEPLPLRPAIGGVALLLICLALRDFLPAWLARGSVVALLAAALYNLSADRRAWALTLGACSYALLARLWEVPWLFATLVAAGAVGAALHPRQVPGEAAPPRGVFRQIALVTFVFCLILLQRLALQGTQDFGGMDLGAGGFGDVNVPAALVGVFLGYKHALCAALALLCVLGPLPPREVKSTLSLLFAAFLLRAAALLAMLFVAGGSYWTGLRVLGELPFALLFAAVVLGCLAAVGVRAQSAGAQASSSSS